MNNKILAIDIGFSSCKCKSGDNIWKFPSHIAPTRDNCVELGDKIPGYIWQKKRYIVGEPDNVSTEPEKYSRDISFLIEYGPLFIAHAISRHEKAPNILALGLPLDQFKTHKDMLRDYLSEFTVDDKIYKFDIRVFAQSVGALAEHISSNKPPNDEDGFVIDIGFNTALVLRYQGLQAKSTGSNQYTQFGISRALEALGATIKNSYGEALTPLELNAACQSGYIRRFGKRIDVSSIAKEAISNHINTLLTTIENDYGRQFAKIDRLVLAGGGATHLAEHLPAKYREFTKILQNPEYANVNGYWRMAWREQ